MFVMQSANYIGFIDDGEALECGGFDDAFSSLHFVSDAILSVALKFDRFVRGIERWESVAKAAALQRPLLDTFRRDA